MRIFKVALILAVVLCLLTSGFLTASVQAQDSDSRYFPETGHTVRGPYLQKYNEAKDPLLMFGYPITDEFVDPAPPNIHSQYFQKARFDWDPITNQVTLANLGGFLHEDNAVPAGIVTNSPACRYFETAGFSVCYAFLQFFDANEGAKFLGDPISDVELREGRYVQYFERGRLEWRPDLPPGQHVLVTDVGRQYFDIQLGNPAYLKPSSGGFNIPGVLPKYSVKAFTTQALIPSGSSQTVYAVVVDQQLNPVAGANVTISFKQAGDLRQIAAQPTNEDGITQVTFPVGELPFNQVVEVGVEAQYQGQVEHTATWFRIWW
jgi:hypothetical protein